MKNATVSAYLSIAGAMLLANPAGGQTIEAARAAYIEGRFVEAAQLGEALGTLEGYALAANSLAIHGYYMAAEDEQPELFARAIRAADEAIRLDPDNPEKALELAPDEIAVYLEYANGLLLLGRNRNWEQARGLLLRGIEIPPKDAYDRILHDLTVETLAALDD